MTDKLPPNLLALFAPRPALRYLPPSDHTPEDRRTRRLDGVTEFLPALQEKATRAQLTEKGDIKPPSADDKDAPPYEAPPTESWLEKRDRKTLETQHNQKWLITDGVKDLYKPSDDANIRGDPYRTLFVARLPYQTDVKELEREFGRFGPIERVRIVTDNGRTKKKGMRKGRSTGYGFVVFDREKDMKAAYKETDHLLIHNRRVLVDVERGRTVQGWKPRRFGGGLGGRGYTKAPAPKPAGFGYGPPSGPGGFRGGGYRGGFDRGGYRGGRGRGGFDRGGFDRGGGYGGGGYGGRGGIGYQSNGMPPDGAPAGPRGGYGDRGGGGGGGHGGGYDDHRGGPRNANYEPIPPRGGGYRDRDGGGGGGGHKRPYEGGGGYDDSRSRRRY